MFTNLLQPKEFLSAGLKTTDIPCSAFYFTLQRGSIKTKTENLPFQKNAGRSNPRHLLYYLYNYFKNRPEALAELLEHLAADQWRTMVKNVKLWKQM